MLSKERFSSITTTMCSSFARGPAMEEGLPGKSRRSDRATETAGDHPRFERTRQAGQAVVSILNTRDRPPGQGSKQRCSKSTSSLFCASGILESLETLACDGPGSLAEGHHRETGTGTGRNATNLEAIGGGC